MGYLGVGCRGSLEAWMNFPGLDRWDFEGVVEAGSQKVQNSYGSMGI